MLSQGVGAIRFEESKLIMFLDLSSCLCQSLLFDWVPWLDGKAADVAESVVAPVDKASQPTQRVNTRIGGLDSSDTGNKLRRQTRSPWPRRKL